MSVQLRPVTAFVPQIVVPGDDPTSSISVTHESEDFAPVDEDHDNYTFTIAEPFEAVSDVNITFRLRADIGARPAHMIATIHGVAEDIPLGEVYNGQDGPYVFYADDPLFPGPNCDEEEAVAELIVSKDWWNPATAGGPAQVYMEFLISAFPIDCPTSFVSVKITYDKVGAPEPFSYTSPACMRFRSWPLTYVGTRGIPRHKWADLAFDPHIGTMPLKVVSEDRNADYDMISLGGLSVSAEEETASQPGKCVAMFPVRGHVRGAVVRVSGSGDCTHVPIP